jgi:glutamine---fructose-6-phosphate transaminase (isomerizing)
MFMCGVYGYVYYGKNKDYKGENLIAELGMASDTRGGHATGIAYRNDKGIAINKAPVDGYKFKYSVPKGTKVVMGHTRFTTQGSEKKNYNNHPFKGYLPSGSFAFAHNGILSNDYELRKKLDIKQTRIETDSYIGVQLIEAYGELSVDSIKYMAELVEGCFVFTILDTEDNIWIVKKDNPLFMARFKERNIIVYASTQEILYSSLRDTNLVSDMWDAIENPDVVEIIPIKNDTITKVCSDGSIETFIFKSVVRTYGNYISSYKNYRLDEYNDYYMEGYVYDATRDAYYPKSTSATSNPDLTSDYDEFYMNEIYQRATHNGFTCEEVDRVMEHGYSDMDVLEALSGGYFDELLDDATLFDNWEEDKYEDSCDLAPTDDDPLDNLPSGWKHDEFSRLIKKETVYMNALDNELIEIDPCTYSG